MVSGVMSYRDLIVHKIDCPPDRSFPTKFQHPTATAFVVYFVLIARERERERAQDVIILISPGNRQAEVKESSIGSDDRRSIIENLRLEKIWTEDHGEGNLLVSILSFSRIIFNCKCIRIFLI